MTLHKIELQWIQGLQHSLRSPFSDTFFLTWNYVDTFPFIIILLGIVWYLIDRRIGINLFYLFLLSSITNVLLKSYFELPRPSQIDPNVGLLSFSSFGFPSGAAQTAALVAFLIWIESNRWSHRCLALLFAFLLCFSRIYLGVHFFSDIAGGLLVGAFLVLVYEKFLATLDNRERKLLFLIPILFLISGIPSKLLTQFGLFTGIAGGLLLQENLEMKTKSWLWKSIEALSAILGILLLFEVKAFFPEWKLLFVFAGGIWFSFLSPYLISKVHPQNRDKVFDT